MNHVSCRTAHDLWLMKTEWRQTAAYIYYVPDKPYQTDSALCNDV